MQHKPLTRTYAPNFVLKALYRKFFDRIRLDDDWAASIRAHAQVGTVVYVLPNLNFIDFLALDHLSKRFHLPEARFANDLGLRILSPLRSGLFETVMPRKDASEAALLRDALSHPRGSAVLFVKRPPSPFERATGSGGRGLKEGEDLLSVLIEAQRSSETPILLVPHVFVWSKRPDSRGSQAIDRFLGPREWPTPARVVGQYLANFRNVTLKSGEALNLKEFLAEHSKISDQAARNRIVYTVLRRIARERRSITGPARKRADRIRQEVLRSPRFRTVLKKLAPSSSEQQEALKRADSILQEMQALPDGNTHSVLEVFLDRVFGRLYQGIDVDEAGLDRVSKAAREGTLVLLPSHKSYIDFVVVSYVFFKANLPMPLIVAGENLSFFPIGGIARRAGAFFIRRTFRGDRLYAATVDAYVRRLIKDGHAIEVFLEGMRSRNGKLLSPKFGLLSMLVDATLSQDSRDARFVPISIGYERIVETGAYRQEISGGEKPKEDAAGLINATRVLRNRYGRINIQFGSILSLGEVATEIGLPGFDNLTPRQTRALVTRLGNKAMDEISRVTAVTPGSLTALALLSHHRRGIAHDKLVRHCDRLHTTLRALGARSSEHLATNTGVLRREGIRQALKLFAAADMIEVHSVSELSRRREATGKARIGAGAVYTTVEAKRIELDTSKNIIVHMFVERALLATAMLPASEDPLTQAVLRERAQYLSKLLKHEFRFRTGLPFDEIFDQVVASMVASGDISVTEDSVVVPGPGRDGWSGHKWLLAYAAMIRNFLEAYRVFVRAMSCLLKDGLSDKDLIKEGINTGRGMYLAGEIEWQESVSKPLLQNALQSFHDQGIIRPAGGKYTLQEEYHSEVALQQLELPIAGYLEREGAL